MQMSELSRASGVPVATIKYYLREGLLPAGTPTSATRSTYGERHLERLRLIRALVEVGRLPIAQVREVVSCVEHPPASWHELLGVVHGALRPLGAPPGGGRGPAPAEAGTGAPDPVPLPDPVPASEDDEGDAAAAHAAVRRLGWRVHPSAPALRDLQRALDAVAAVGLPMTPERLEIYASAAASVAEADVAGVPTDSAEEAARHVAVGTVLYEPVLLSLRRLAQEDASARRFGVRRDAAG